MVGRPDAAARVDGAANLPDGWRTVRFGDVVRNANDQEPDPLEAGIERYVGLEHLDAGSLHIRRWGLVEEGTTFTRKFSKGQVLFPKRRVYQRKAAMAEFEGVCSGDILVFEPKAEALLPELLPFIAQSDAFFEHALQTSAGSLSPRTRWRDLARYEFPLPRKNEQRGIAEILWATDDATERFESLKSALRASRNAVNGALGGADRAEMVPLGEVAAVSNGTTPSRSKDRYWEGGTVPWLPTGKVHDRYIIKADEFITEDALSECSLRVLPAGTVLVAMIGQGKTRGMAARMEIDACINQNFAGVVPSGKLDSWYLFYYLAASYERLRHVSQGSSQGALNCALIKKFPFPLRPKAEQVQIARQLRAIDHRIIETDAHLEALRRVRKALASRLLACRPD